jgi:serine protease Do
MVTSGAESKARFLGVRPAHVAIVSTAFLIAGTWTLAPRIVHAPPHAAPAVVDATSSRSLGFADLVDTVKPAVFAVRVKLASTSRAFDLPGTANRSLREINPSQNSPLGASPPAVAQGSGFFISPDGYALTNQHVVEGNKVVEITTDDGVTRSARVVGSDSGADLALIKVDGREDFPYARLADRMPRVGDWVLAVGNPFGLGGTVTAGIVSARERDIGVGPYDDFIQIDAPVNKGNSGGPSFDVDGGVIGVNTAIYSPSGGSVGIAFVIPSSTVKSVVAQLKRDGVVRRGFIGVQVQPLTADIAESLGLARTEGALITDQQPGSPAAKAGISAGDIVTAIDGEPIRDSRDFSRRVANLAPGTSATLNVLRGGHERTVAVVLAALPGPKEPVTYRASANDEANKRPGLGLSLAPADIGGSGEAGVVVTEVEPQGRGAEQGLGIGDIILDVGGRQVKTPADVHGALADAQRGGRRSVLMRVRSGDKTRFVALPVG